MNGPLRITVSDLVIWYKTKTGLF